jgi:hypothetical protein
LHDWCTGHEAAVTETYGQLSPSTVQVDCAPVPAQKVPLPVHDASVALQTQRFAPVVPPQLWCVPQVWTVADAVTQLCASAVHVVTWLADEQYVPAPTEQIAGGALQTQAALGSEPWQVWLALGQAVGPAEIVWQPCASVAQVVRPPPLQKVPVAVQPVGSGLHSHTPELPLQVSFAVQAVVPVT